MIDLMVTRFDDVPMATVIDPTKDISPVYNKHIPSLLIHENYSDKLIEILIERQKDAINR